MKKPIYLNHAATSNHKFEATINELCAYLQKNSNSNTNRGGNGFEEQRILFETRQTLADFFHAPDPAHVVFTLNATMSLNMVLNGLVTSGDHVLTTNVEHNAVSRPLNLLEKKQNISVTQLICKKDGFLDPAQLKEAIRPETKVLVMTHASNVLGTILPIKECFKQAKQAGVLTVLDSAQTAGLLPIDLQEMFIDVLTFTGHKSLMGLTGIGGIVLGKGIEKQINPWLTGGTGSHSQSFDQPTFLPDKFESGTLNMLGILSLKSSILSIQKIGIEKILNHERMLTARFLNGLKKLPVTILGTQEAEKSVPVVSIVVPNIDSGEVAQALDTRYGIITRSGLHCSPLSHKTAGTLKTGAVRFSFGLETTIEEIDYTLVALEEIVVT